MEIIFTFEGIFILSILTFLEIILGIDNVIFISLAVQKLPKNIRAKARYFGISLALIIRCAMLFAISWIISLNQILFSFQDFHFSYRHIILFFGGLFLIYTSISEILQDLSKKEKNNTKIKIKSTLMGAIFQIMMIDIIFSLDSIITAIGITNHISIIIIAVIISMFFMIFLSGKISHIIDKFPSLKIIALVFIAFVGVMLVIDAFSIHISKNYLYFALFFTGIIEIINIKIQNRNNDGF